MDELNNKIEDLLPSYFQSRIKIRLDEKDIATGRFILYTMKGFNFVLILKLDNERMSKIVFPRPFNCTKYDSKIVCDYRLSTLENGIRERAKELKNLKIYEKSKYFDKIAEIIHIPPTAQ